MLQKPPSLPLEVVTFSAADEAYAHHIFVNLPLGVSELREGVDNDTKDDVQTNCRDNDEEGHIKEGDSNSLGEAGSHLVLKLIVSTVRQSMMKYRDETLANRTAVSAIGGTPEPVTIECKQDQRINIEYSQTK